MIGTPEGCGRRVSTVANGARDILLGPLARAGWDLVSDTAPCENSASAASPDSVIEAAAPPGSVIAAAASPGSVIATEWLGVPLVSSVPATSVGLEALCPMGREAANAVPRTISFHHPLS
eukprot:1435570-Prymnesium_polylepis.2